MILEPVSQNGSFLYLHSREWANAGIVHGFGGINFGRSLQAWSNDIQVRSQISLSQVHGDKVVEIDLTDIATNPEGDAMVFDHSEASPSGRSLIYVKSADCVPLLCRYGSRLALIHAGWRGLASGVIERTLERLFLSQPTHASLEILIGPSAEGCCYEVGDEVESALKQYGAFYQSKHDLNKRCLSTSETAARIVEANINLVSSKLNAPLKLSLVRSKICTICSKEYHSYRRERSKAGRNFSFILRG